MKHSRAGSRSEMLKELNMKGESCKLVSGETYVCKKLVHEMTVVFFGVFDIEEKHLHK